MRFEKPFDPRADLAELRSQVRYLADEFEVTVPPPDLPDRYDLLRLDVIERLRALVGPWPHEARAASVCNGRCRKGAADPACPTHGRGGRG